MAERKMEKKMNSYNISFGGVIWSSSRLAHGTEVYYTDDVTGILHVLKKFPSAEEARMVCGILKEKSHVNVANVSPLFSVDDEEGTFVAVEKKGKSFEEFLYRDENKQRFLDGNRISPFYQRILFNLLDVTRYLMDDPIDFKLAMSDVYIMDSTEKPHITLTDFHYAGCDGSNSDWGKLASFVEAINKKVGLHEQIQEMTRFLHILRNPSRNGFKELLKLPLFWTSVERANFPCRVWDALKVSNKDGLFHGLELPFTLNLWDEALKNNQDLSTLKNGSDAYEILMGRTPIGLPAGGKNLDLAATNQCLALIRNCAGLYHEMRKSGHMPFNTIMEVANMFERIFPTYIIKTHAIAVRMEKILPVLIVPRRNDLKNLFKEPTH